MKVKIQLRPELYDQIRTLVHDELNEQENQQKSRKKFEQLAMKIRAQLDQLSSPQLGSQVVQKSIRARY